MKRFLSLAFTLFFLEQLNAQIFFSSLTSYSLGASPISALSYDFNKDGFLDLATTNQNGSNISISLGNGKGSFGAPTFYTVGNSPRNITTADFNKDGNIDLAVGNTNGSSMSVLLGTATGTFGAATTHTLSTGAGVTAIVSADFNGDGNLDIATSDSGPNKVSIFLGTGTGGFGSPSYISVGGSGDMVTGDFNGDGKADLATCSVNTTDLSILLGTGAGTFSITNNPGSNYVSLTTSDFNGDGRPDLAVVDQLNNQVLITLGTSSGNFNYLTTINVGASPIAVISADFNRDGKQDLAVTNSNDNNIYVFFGTGTGLFGTPSIIPAGSHPWNMACGDFNGDGNPDIALSDGNNDSFMGVLLNEFPYFTISGPTTICKGSNTTLVASGANTYTWAPASGLNTTTSATVIASPTVTTTYTITGVYGDTIGKITLKITVVPNPTISLNSPTICQGQQAIVTASGADTYLWNTGATTSSITPSPTVTTIYTVTGTNSGICAVTKTTSVSVLAAPVISVTGGNSQAVCSGDSVTAILFNLSPAGSTVNWTNNNTSIGLASSGAGNISAYAAPVVSSQLNAIITAVATATNSCHTQLIYTLSVNPFPVVTIAGADTVCAGTPATLTASGATSYSWSTSNTGAVINPSPTINTTYTVIGNTNNCSDTTSITVVVKSLPTVQANATASVVCLSNVTTLTGSGATTYTWTSSVVDGLAFVPVTTNTYTVTGTGANNCVNSASVTVTVNNLPNVQANATATVVCAGDITTLTGGGANTYTWTSSVIDGTSFAPAATDTYTVTGTDANNCVNSALVTVTVNNLPNVQANATASVVCEGQSTTLTGSGTATTYTWTSTIVDGLAFAPAATNTYTVTGTDANGCSNSNTILLTVNTLPLSPILSGGNNPITFCQGASVPTLTVNNNGDISVWYNYQNNIVAYDSSYTLPNNLPYGTLSYNIIDSSATTGCVSAPLTLTLTINLTPTATITTSVVCLNEPTIFSINLSPTTASNFFWDFGNGNVAGTQSPAQLYANCGTYTVSCTYTTMVGCSNFVTAIAIVNCLPGSSINVTQTSCGLCNASATVTTTGGTPPYQYTWSTGIQPTVVSGLCAGTDTCFITDVSGCKDTVVAVINNSTTAGLSATFTITANATPHVWDVYPNVTGGSAPYTYVWSWGDGTTDNVLYTNHTYTAVGNYSVCLTVTDNNGCSNTYCQNDSLYRTAGTIQINVINGSMGLQQVLGNGPQVTIYPNPASQEFNIAINQTLQNGTALVYDINGRIVWKKENIQGNETIIINSSNFQKGVYFIEVSESNKKIFNNKLIIQ